MAIPSWPALLPQLRGLDNASGTDALVPPAMTTDMDDGPARVRRRTLMVTTPLKMGVYLTFQTLPILQGFVRDTLNGGASRFTAPVLCPNGQVQNRTCRIKDGLVAITWRGVQPVASFTLVVWDW